jgi:hypothetical protein
MYVCMYVWMDGWMDVSMYVCMYVHAFLPLDTATQYKASIMNAFVWD